MPLEVFKSLALSDHERPLPRSWLTTCKTMRCGCSPSPGHLRAMPLPTPMEGVLILKSFLHPTLSETLPIVTCTLKGEEGMAQGPS